MFKRYFCQFR